MDDGADPNAIAAGRSPTRRIYVTNRSAGLRAAGPFTAGEALNPSNWVSTSMEPSHESLEEQSSRRRFRPRRRLPAPPMYDDVADSTWQDLLTGELLGASDAGFGRRRPGPSAPPSETEEHPRKVSSSELDGEVTDFPTLDGALSLSDPPPLTPEITGEETDDDDAYSHVRAPGYVRHSIGLINVTRSMLLSLGDSLFTTVSVEEMCKPRRAEHSEESLSKLKEYIDSQPSMSFEEAFDSLLAVEHATLTALAAEKGTELPRDPFLIDQEAMSLQAQQQDSEAAAHPQNAMKLQQELLRMESDEDIPTNITRHGSVAPSHVRSLHTKFDYNVNENFILPKCSIFVLLRFTHIGAASGPKETSFTKEKMIYMEAEPTQYLLSQDSSSKSHAHQHVQNSYELCIWMER
ncbi:hypothetical protein EJB05_26201 [Eragrostis curvula]|uniref:Uncharacterized protein n=1 Tax=Eragrostis curvula TaxID=38414 RepID=A0A5J9UKJ0_9POAL|nr:hypothetical protein EJB05_26194 [Eragrostis curvula]TVU23818.1 hypothetical protein EJB05_26201 [Eragrostis curvula]